jgi:hypothetical protein
MVNVTGVSQNVYIPFVIPLVQRAPLGPLSKSPLKPDKTSFSGVMGTLRMQLQGIGLEGERIQYLGETGQLKGLQRRLATILGDRGILAPGTRGLLDRVLGSIRGTLLRTRFIGLGTYDLRPGRVLQLLR